MKRLISFSIIFGLLCMTVAAQVYFDQVRTQHLKTTLKATYNELIEPTLPDSAVLDKITFGFNTVVADVLWLKTVQYYGGGDPQGKYRQLPHLIDAITTLDPRFSYPYTFAALVLPYEGFADEALRILEAGERALPNSWEIPYSAATLYYVDKKDSAHAAAYYQKAAALPGALPIAEFLSAVQYERTDNYTTALEIYTKLADTSTNAYIRDQAKAHQIHFFLLDQLQKAADAFTNQNGQHPSSLDQLVQQRYIPEIPTSPLNRPFLYDSQTGKVTSPLKKLPA